MNSPWYKNYFLWLILVSLFFFGLEQAKPWRQKQAKFRKDFWLDVFYMFFNFFLFSLVIYNAASNVVVNFFNNTIINLTGFDLQASNPLNDFPFWSILLIGFIFRDFIQWWIHRLLHRIPKLWEYLFKTDYIPYEGRDIELGFEEEEDFPQDFKGQIKHGF